MTTIIFKITLAALIVMAGLIFLCFVLALCKAARRADDEEEDWRDGE